MWQEFLAGLCTVAGAVGLCLASPQQRLRTVGLHARRWRVAFALLLVAGFVGWSLVLQPVAGFFVALTMTMGVWVLLPYLAAWQDVGR